MATRQRATARQVLTQGASASIAIRQRHLLALLCAFAVAFALTTCGLCLAAPLAFADDQPAASSTPVDTTTTPPSIFDDIIAQASSPDKEIDPDVTLKVVLLCTLIPLAAGVLAVVYKKRQIKAAKAKRELEEQDRQQH